MSPHVHAACIECGRPIRRRSESDADVPGGVRYGAHGRCDVCYQRLRRGSVIADTAAPTFHKDRHVELVRWILTPDGSEPELIAGIYVGRRRDVWLIKIAGRVCELPRNEWLGCVA